MRRFLPLIMALGLSLATVPGLHAEDAVATQKLDELRQAVEAQSRQISILAEQVGKLTKALETQKVPEPTVKINEVPPTAAPAPSPVPAASAEGTKPTSETAPEAPKGEAIPKAEAVPGTKHVVTKGETLTSIAKHYNISIADLKNANKIDNERKLQIGQILSVPTAKTPEPTDKKENP
ncbi:LysM peptidoglycan-binding domain-containing protein [Chthoniobacter flavus]|nr:LysM domain-containing protein [Chthoniobacter flavus]